MVHRLLQVLASHGIGTYYAVYYAGYLTAVAALVFAIMRYGRRVPSWLLTVGRVAVVVLLARLVLFDNPVSFHYYVRSIGAADIGYRQYDAVMLEIAKYRRDLDDGDRPAYLAVGSSQVAGIFYVWNSDYPDLMNVFSLAGMRSIDYLLYRDYIDAYRPKAVVLYLSGGDFALVPDLNSMNLAPSAPTVAPGVLNRLRRHGLLSGANLAPVHEYLAVQLLPEYRWSFLFRDWVKRQARRATLAAESPAAPAASPAAASPTAASPTVAPPAAPPPAVAVPAVPDEGAAQPAPESARSAAETDWRRGLATAATEEYPAERIARFEESYDQRWMALYLSFLEDFVRFCEDRGIPVIINEGQFNPVAVTPKIKAIQDLGVRALRELSRRHPSVRFVPASEVYTFSTAEYSDLVHVHSDAAARYTRRFGEYLHRLQTASTDAPCRYQFSPGWYPLEWQDGQHWLRWSDGRASIELQAKAAGTWAVDVDLLPAVQPNALTVLVNDQPVATRETGPGAGDMAISATFQAPAGASVIRFASREAPALGGDGRPRSVAIRNFRIRPVQENRRQTPWCLPADID